VEETRKLIREWPHPNKTIVERDRNWGLANSVIEGVTQLCERFGWVIVVEDDLVVSPVFLNYLNTALLRYVDEPMVMQVSAHMFPIDIQAQTDAVMLPFITSWGWATWYRAWKHFDPNMSGFEKLKANGALRRRFDLDGSYPYFQMLKHQANNKIDSWAIRWYLSVFLMEGLTLHPCHSLVRNEGYGLGATHTSINSSRKIVEIWKHRITQFPLITIQTDVVDIVSKYLKSESSLRRRILSRLIETKKYFTKKR